MLYSVFYNNSLTKKKLKENLKLLLIKMQYLLKVADKTRLLW